MKKENQNQKNPLICKVSNLDFIEKSQIWGIPYFWAGIWFLTSCFLKQWFCNLHLFNDLWILALDGINQLFLLSILL